MITLLMSTYEFTTGQNVVGFNFLQCYLNYEILQKSKSSKTLPNIL